MCSCAKLSLLMHVCPRVILRSDLENGSLAGNMYANASVWWISGPWKKRHEDDLAIAIQKIQSHKSSDSKLQRFYNFCKFCNSVQRPVFCRLFSKLQSVLMSKFQAVPGNSVGQRSAFWVTFTLLWRNSTYPKSWSGIAKCLGNKRVSKSSFNLNLGDFGQQVLTHTSTVIKAASYQGSSETELAKLVIKNMNYIILCNVHIMFHRRNAMNSIIN